MPLQILTLKLDGITADDSLTWCRDPDPPALDLTLRSIAIDADPLGDSITAILDWTRPLPPPPPPTAAAAAGLPLSTGVQVHPLPTAGRYASPGFPDPGVHEMRTVATAVGAARIHADDLISHEP